MEIIRLVEGTDLPVRATLRQMNIPRSTFYNWYRRYVDHGFDGLHDQKPAPRPRWNAIPEKIQNEVLDLALECTDLSPRELACRYTDEKRYFVSESSIYRILKAADLITGPAYVSGELRDYLQETRQAYADYRASARHAVVQGDPATGQAFVEDVGSRNGTFVNEQKLAKGTQRQLHDNDRLRLGSITFVVKLLASG